MILEGWGDPRAKIVRHFWCFSHQVDKNGAHTHIETIMKIRDTTMPNESLITTTTRRSTVERGGVKAETLIAQMIRLTINPFVLLFGLVTVVLVNFGPQQFNRRDYLESPAQRTVVKVTSDNVPSVNTALLDDDFGRSQLPLFVGAGLAVTGTQTMMEAFCLLSIPTVHNKETCVRQSKETEIDDPTKSGLEAHQRVMTTYRRLKACAKRGRCSDYSSITTSLLENVADVVRSGVVAVGEAPYSLLVPYLVEIAERERPAGAFVVMTERDPASWAANRLEFKMKDVACRDADTAFDLRACLSTEQDPSKLMDSSKNLTSAKEKKNVRAFLEEAMQKYQRRIKEMHPVFSVDLWNETTVDAAHFSAALSRSTKNLLHPDAIRYLWRPPSFVLGSEPVKDLLSDHDQTLRQSTSETVRPKDTVPEMNQTTPILNPEAKVPQLASTNNTVARTTSDLNLVICTRFR